MVAAQINLKRGEMTNYLNAAAAWDRTGEVPQYDRMAYASAGPPPWTAGPGQDWSTFTEQSQPPPPKGPSWVKVVLIVAATVVALLVGLVVLGAAIAVNEAPQPGFTTMPPEGAAGPAKVDASAGPVVHAIGKPFLSGDFKYTVHGVKTGLDSVGGEYIQESAQGAFTRLDVTIENVSKRPLYFDTDLRVKLRDAKGRQFSADTQANVVGNAAEKGFFTEINPGNKIRAFAYFDLPAKTTATQVVVSAGLFSFEADAVVPIS